MADIPIENTVVETKKVPLTNEQRLDLLERDIQELARGVNLQAQLLESIVVTFDHVVKKYLTLTHRYIEPKAENQNEAEEKTN